MHGGRGVGRFRSSIDRGERTERDAPHDLASTKQEKGCRGTIPAIYGRTSAAAAVERRRGLF